MSSRRRPRASPPPGSIDSAATAGADSHGCSAAASTAGSAPPPGRYCSSSYAKSKTPDTPAVHVGAAEPVLGDLLAGDRLDHVRPVMFEHLRSPDHEHEVRQRRVSRRRSPRAGPASREICGITPGRRGCCAGRCRRTRRAPRRPPGSGPRHRR